ncbi:MAG TPA: hypothetical protein PKE00_04065, partial [Planctomycetota bacterium]|nr:hypothetical protein [Planctomycetota bacterium]
MLDFFARCHLPAWCGHDLQGDVQVTPLINGLRRLTVDVALGAVVVARLLDDLVQGGFEEPGSEAMLGLEAQRVGAFGQLDANGLHDVL